MAVPIGINGFGRIGRLVARILLRDPERFELRLVNELADPVLLARLLEHDSTYGPLGRGVRADAGGLAVAEGVGGPGGLGGAGARFRVTREEDPARIPWKDAGVELVLEATGAFCERSDLERHLAAGAERVLLSAPPKGEAPLDAMICLGVNDADLRPDHRLVSNASCTTNCLAPMLKVLDEGFGIQEALATTVHAYTTSQNLLDGIGKSVTRARSAMQNIIPTTTGAARATVELLPQLEGRLTAMAMRVPVPTGSVVDLNVRCERPADRDAVNDAMRSAAEGPLRGILEYTEREIVSSEIIANPHSAIVDGAFTAHVGDRTVKLLGWYDNEWGYAARCVDMLGRLAELDSPRA